VVALKAQKSFKAVPEVSEDCPSPSAANQKPSAVVPEPVHCTRLPAVPMPAVPCWVEPVPPAGKGPF